jgi:hypothetical protein
VEVAIQTEHGVYTVDVETEEVVDLDADAVLPGEPWLETGLPRVVAAAASGSTVVAIVDRRPPLAVSYDGGSTWHETGGGLPRGHAVAVSRDDPDLVVFAGRNRLFLSRDGGRFWSALAPELPAIQAIDLAE